MTNAEFAQWVAFDGISPIGDERHDIGRAVIAQTVALMNGAKDASITDFMPFRERPKVANEMEAALLRWAEKEGTRGQ